MTADIVLWQRRQSAIAIEASAAIVTVVTTACPLNANSRGYHPAAHALPKEDYLCTTTLAMYTPRPRK
jgi:hypothetical protein